MIINILKTIHALQNSKIEEEPKFFASNRINYHPKKD